MNSPCGKVLLCKTLVVEQKQQGGGDIQLLVLLHVTHDSNVQFIQLLLLHGGGWGIHEVCK